MRYVVRAQGISLLQYGYLYVDGVFGAFTEFLLDCYSRRSEIMLRVFGGRFLL